MRTQESVVNYVLDVAGIALDAHRHVERERCVTPIQSFERNGLTVARESYETGVVELACGTEIPLATTRQCLRPTDETEPRRAFGSTRHLQWILTRRFVDSAHGLALNMEGEFYGCEVAFHPIL
jgi:hypothetical protein